MNIKTVLKNQIPHFIYLNKINIAGEITIQGEDILSGISGDEVLFGKIQFCTQNFTKSYPWLKVESVRNLHEITIKLFAYNKPFSDNAFLDKFSQDVEHLLKELSELESLSLKLNIYGDLNTLRKVEKFRCVNTGSNVYYKVTESVPKSTVSVAISDVVERVLGK